MLLVEDDDDLAKVILATFERAGVDGDAAVVSRAIVCGQLLPLSNCCVPCRASGRVCAAGEVLKGPVVGRNQARAGAAFNRHIAHGHALFHGERADGAARVFEDAARSAADADAGNQRENNILRRDAGVQRAIHLHLERLRFALQQTLRGQHMFHFTGADAKCERAECAVRGGVAVAADHGHAGLSQTEFGSDDMDNSLACAMYAQTADAEIRAIGFELCDLPGGDLIHYGQRAIAGRNAVIHRGDGEIAPPHFEAAFAQPVEGLRRCDFVDQVKVDKEQCGSARLLVDNVRVPKFFDNSACHKRSANNVAPAVLPPVFSRRSLNRGADGSPNLFGSRGSPGRPQIRCDSAALQHRFDGRIHRRGFFLQSEAIQQHGAGRTDGAERIRLVLPGDIGRGAMYRLIQAHPCAAGALGPD